MLAQAVYHSRGDFPEWVYQQGMVVLLTHGVTPAQVPAQGRAQPLPGAQLVWGQTLGGHTLQANQAYSVPSLKHVLK